MNEILKQYTYFDKIQTPHTTPRRCSYNTALKLEIAEYAKSNGNRSAARKFGVDESNVRLWRKSKPMLDKIPRLKRANRGAPAHFLELEKQLVDYIGECRQQGLALSTIQIRLKAQLFAKPLDRATFKASSHWCYRFRARHDLSIRRKTHIVQKLPDDLEHKVTVFQRGIIQRRKELNPPLSLIGNADSTHLRPPNPTSPSIRRGHLPFSCRRLATKSIASPWC